MLDGSILDIWGPVFVNGNPLALIGAIPIATQPEAEAGTDNSKVMTPLRARQGEIYFLAHMPDLQNLAWPASQIYGTSNLLALNSDGGAPIIKLMLNGTSKFFLAVGSATLSVPLYLPSDPTDPFHAATKQYVDAHSGGGGGITDGDKTDITVSGAGTIWTIDNSVVTNAKSANMVASTMKGRGAGSTGAPQDLTPSQARTILASDSGGGTTNFFRADGTWAAPVGSTLRTVNTYSGTALTTVSGDGGAYIRCTGTNPTYTLPPNSSVSIPVGTQIDGLGVNTAMTIVAGAGVTVNKARTLVTLGAKSGWTAVKVATDEWDVHGDFV
jgi:hypothetical protein